MSAFGIIFSNIHDKSISELTRVRTMAAVPFFGRYRLVDFALSNMVNSGIMDINIIAHHNYASLTEHIGSGKDWDMARRSGGIRILPPFISNFSEGGTVYGTRLEALLSISRTVFSINERYTVLSDCDVICNIDLTDMIREHEASGAVLTAAVKRFDSEDDKSDDTRYVISDGSGRIRDIITEKSRRSGMMDRSLNIFVINTDFLKNALRDAAERGFKSFTKDVLIPLSREYRFMIYRCEGYVAALGSLSEYYGVTMDILSDPEKSDVLFGCRERPVYTRECNSPPTIYSNDAEVSNSYIADGCRICGKVENSVIFRGVEIKRGAVIQNSILFGDCVIGSGTVLNCVVADKNVKIRGGRILSSCSELPFYIDKDTLL